MSGVLYFISHSEERTRTRVQSEVNLLASSCSDVQERYLAIRRDSGSDVYR